MSSSVLPVRHAIAEFGESKVRWMIGRGSWQRPFRGVIVTHSGPLTDDQRIQAILLAHGPDAVVAGLTAAATDGLSFYASPGTHVLIPGQHQRRKIPGAVVHRSQALTEADVHPLRQPPRTRLPRSIVDATSWAGSNLHARAIIATSIQQRLTRPADLRAVAEASRNLRRRSLILETITDAEGGSHSVNELDFLNTCRNFGLPLPEAGEAQGRGRPLAISGLRLRRVPPGGRGGRDAAH